MVKPASLPARPRRPPPLAPTSSSSSSSSSSADGRFKGVRMRSWGRWVSEIRIPHSRDKIWLGSYGTAQQAARAYDVASLLLRGPSCAAFLNFSDSTVLMMDRLAPLANGVASPRTIQVTAAAVANAETGAATEFQPCNRMPADDDEAKQSLNSEIITEESSQWRKDQQGESADTLESMSCWIQDVISLLSPKDKTSPPATTSIPCFNGNSPSNALHHLARATSLEPFNTMIDEFHPFESLAWEGFTVMSPAVTTRERFDTDTGCGEVDGSLWS